MLAIIIPYYKITFFEATLVSLANQTDKRFKVYIGDDASMEDPTAILEKYKGQFDFEYHKFEENLGGKSLTKQWERCIALSQNEEWMMILGDDDVLGENVVEAFYSNLPEIVNTSNVVRFASCKINDAGQEISKTHENTKIELSIDFLFRKSRSSLSEYIFNSKQIKTIGFKDFPLGWFSDVLAVLEFSNFENVFSINEAIVYIRISSISISGKKDNVSIKEKATFEFYYYLITQKNEMFNEFQKSVLQHKVNKCYLNNKRNGILFFKISKYYLTNFLILDYFKFLKSVAKMG
ncbi:MAG TPA: glycosyltransferase family 2 protein [Lutibacter sp.]